MKANIIITGTKKEKTIQELFEKKTEKVLSLLKKFDIKEVRCLWMSGEEDEGKTDGWFALRQAEEEMESFMEEEDGAENTVTIFYGDFEGLYLGMKAAASLQKSCHTDVIKLKGSGKEMTAVKRVFGAHLDAYFPVYDDIIILYSGIEAEKLTEEEKERMMKHFHLEMREIKGEKTDWVRTIKKENENELSEAKIVFIGGKGLKTKENYQKMVSLARKKGAAWGCTRAAALSGWESYERVIGISGQTLHAEMCILFGVSGAAPFMAGLEKTKTIAAINTDRSAPVFSGADYGVEADAVLILERLLNR